MPFAPSDISGLKVWLKDTVSGSDNDPVSTWPGSDANTNDFVQATSGRKPVLKKAIRNGLDAVLFDGSDDLLDGGNLQGEFTNSAASVFIAYAPNSDVHYNVLINSDNDAWFVHDSGPYQGLFRTSRIAGFADSTPTDGWHVFTLITGSDYRVWVDGVADSENPQTASWDDGSTFFYLGGRSFDDPGAQNRHMAGYVAEVIIYDTALSGTDRADVETYLLARWVASPATSTPAVVAGVGAVPAATAKGNGTGVPSVTAGVGAVPAPTAMGTAFAVPAAVAGIGAVPAPFASGTGAGQASPNAVAGIGSVPAPTAMGNSTAVPAVVVGVGSVPAPTAKGNSTAVPAAVVGIGAVPAPTASGVANGTALPANVTVIGQVPFPTAEGEGTGGGGGSPDGASDYWTIVLAS